MDIPSDISTIRVADRGRVRTLYFRKDSGRQAMESQVDLDAPHRLRLRYTRSMFASYLFVSDPRRVLLIGLGGGAMVRFWERYEPDLWVDAVDVDPAVVALATAQFGARPGPRVRLIAADGLAHLRSVDDGSYDVIYVDAFLGSRADTDASGVPLHLKGAGFHAELGRALSPRGVAVFNLHMARGVEDEIAVLRAAFGGVHHFIVPHSRNHIVVVGSGQIDCDLESLRAAAARAAPRFDGEFSISAFIEDLQED